jgi:flagellin-specific chaperone FliS
MNQKLSEAHLKNDPKLLQEVYKLLADLKTTWDSIDPKHPTNATAMEA